MNVIIKTKEDQAEDIICRWYSWTRNSNIEEPWVVQLLFNFIAFRLVKDGVNVPVAEKMAERVINDWANECEGINANEMIVFDVLVARVAKIL